ncbi:MAG: cytidylate kinase-like family protein [Balneolales bacterium]|nr:cytidylate kinase-like family protein [Balneolales bacterium]
MAKRVAQMIEDQVRFWRINHPIEHKLQHKGQNLPVITISREFGAQGAAIARILEKRLGFKVWDKEILEVISKKLGSDVDYIKSLDEHTQNAVEDTIFGFLNRKSTNLNYSIYLIRALQAIEKYGNAIIVGRGGNFICQNRKTFNVRVVAPLTARINHIAGKEGISIEEARAIICTKDEERARFTEHNFNKNIDAPEHYDLVINSDTLGLESASELIIIGYQEKIGHHITVMQAH